MKLDKTQINALAGKIAREINIIKQQEYDSIFQQKKQEMQSKVDADLTFVEALLSKSPVYVAYQVYSFPNCTFGKSGKVSDYQVQNHFGLINKAITQEQIREDLILETIEDYQTLDSLIQTIKNKYVTN